MLRKKIGVGTPQAESAALKVDGWLPSTGNLTSDLETSPLMGPLLVGCTPLVTCRKAACGINGCSMKVSHGEPIHKDSHRPRRDTVAAKYQRQRMAGNQSGTGRSAMLAVGPFLGRSGR